MSLIKATRCASAPLDHRLDVGDGKTVLVGAKNGLCSPPLALCAHPPSYHIGTIPAAHRTADLIPIVPITLMGNELDSNPHSAMPPLAACQTARGFLPRGLSDAYRRTC